MFWRLQPKNSHYRNYTYSFVPISNSGSSVSLLLAASFPLMLILNMFFSTSLQLTDFGLSRYYHSFTRSSKKNNEEEGGTNSYMPPEAFDISYSPTRASDIYRYHGYNCSRPPLGETCAIYHVINNNGQLDHAEWAAGRQKKLSISPWTPNILMICSSWCRLLLSLICLITRWKHAFEKYWMIDPGMWLSLSLSVMGYSYGPLWQGNNPIQVSVRLPNVSAWKHLPLFSVHVFSIMFDKQKCQEFICVTTPCSLASELWSGCINELVTRCNYVRGLS